MGGYLGLNYQTIDIIINRRELVVTPEMFEDLMVMETFMLTELNKKET